MLSENVYRWSLAGILGVGLAMSVYFRRRADRARGAVSRRQDGPVFLVLQGVFAIAALGGLVLFVVNPAWTAWSQWPLPAWLRLAGIPIAAVALALFLWVFRSLGENVTPTARTRENHSLVVAGPYRWVRHPMYSSGVVLSAAYFLLTANWFIAVMCVLTFAMLVLRTSAEEANLVERFGDEYLRYMHRTGRFVPRLRP